jgi:hypothetical protein
MFDGGLVLVQDSGGGPSAAVVCEQMAIGLERALVGPWLASPGVSVDYVGGHGVRLHRTDTGRGYVARQFLSIERGVSVVAYVRDWDDGATGVGVGCWANGPHYLIVANFTGAWEIVREPDESLLLASSVSYINEDGVTELGLRCFWETDDRVVLQGTIDGELIGDTIDTDPMAGLVAPVRGFVGVSALIEGSRGATIGLSQVRALRLWDD